MSLGHFYERHRRAILRNAIIAVALLHSAVAVVGGLYVLAAKAALLRAGGLPAVARGTITLWWMAACGVGLTCAIASRAGRRRWSLWPFFEVGGWALFVAGVLGVRSGLRALHETIVIPPPHATIGLWAIAFSMIAPITLLVALVFSLRRGF